MSVEMVACIAIEAISILEKMHSRGLVSLIFFWLLSYCSLCFSPYFYFCLLSYWIYLWNPLQICPRWCKAWKFFARLSWVSWWEKTIPCWSWVRYYTFWIVSFSCFYYFFVIVYIFLWFCWADQQPNGGIQLVCMWNMTRDLMFSGISCVVSQIGVNCHIIVPIPGNACSLNLIIVLAIQGNCSLC